MSAVRKIIPKVAPALAPPSPLCVDHSVHPVARAVALSSSIDFEPASIRLAPAQSSQSDGRVLSGRAVDYAHSLNLYSLAVSSPHDPAEREASSTAGPRLRASIYIPEPSVPLVPILSAPSRTDFSRVTPKPD